MYNHPRSNKPRGKNDALAQMIKEVQGKYDVGPGYARAYLEYWFNARGKQFKKLSDILQAPLPQPMWFDYALSTNWRGEMIANSMAPYLKRGDGRFLDVGCGFGGCLVAFSRLGMTVLGIEIDEQRAGFAQANCTDYGLPVDCVLTGDILEEGLPARLGHFDLITCMDVIEHVLDVPLALRNMVELLRPGGHLLLEIPNRKSINFVSRDGHFALFGITLLERSKAIEYHAAFFDNEYDVGEYYDLGFYQDRLNALGCRSELIRSNLQQSRSLAETGLLMRAAFKNFVSFLRNADSGVIRSELSSRFAIYAAKALLDTALQVLLRRNQEKFRRTYLTDFWTLLAIKAEG
jgi:2-polyprenyl-3-methyl-5-hydroxy-6-metoxy-1,4-benzoquinol methylase